MRPWPALASLLAAGALVSLPAAAATFIVTNTNDSGTGSLRWPSSRPTPAPGCAAGLYCPSAPVTREQMAVFLTVTFALRLYGP